MEHRLKLEEKYLIPKFKHICNVKQCGICVMLKSCVWTLFTHDLGQWHTKFWRHAIFPLEELYPELKEEFQITNWTSYFSAILNELDSLMSDYEKS